MRFWEFNVVELIEKKKDIYRTCEALERQIQLATEMINHPVWGDKGEWELYKQILELRYAEFDCYRTMLRNGLQDLPELERAVLEMWLQEKRTDDYILRVTDIANKRELNKIKAISVAKFKKIVMPD